MRLISEADGNICAVLFPMAVDGLPRAHLTTASRSPIFLLHRHISDVSRQLLLMTLELYFQWISSSTCMSDFSPLIPLFLLSALGWLSASFPFHFSFPWE